MQLHPLMMFLLVFSFQYLGKFNLNEYTRTAEMLLSISSIQKISGGWRRPWIVLSNLAVRRGNIRKPSLNIVWRVW